MTGFEQISEALEGIATAIAEDRRKLLRIRDSIDKGRKDHEGFFVQLVVKEGRPIMPLRESPPS